MPIRFINGVTMIAPMMPVRTTATAVSDGSACNDSLMPIATPAVTDFGASDRTTARGKPAAAPAEVGHAVFPSAVSPKYARESAGKARMHTCVDQYNANKTANANGGLKWIQKGGGYYSECTKKLKG